MVKIFLLVFLFFNCTAGLAQLSAQAKQIAAACKFIDKDSSLEKKIYEQEEFMDHVTDNGASLTFYHKNGTVHRITEWIGLSGHAIIIDYYFKAGKLIYVRDEELVYERNAKGETTGKFSKDDRFLGQYFFRNDQLFDAESLGHNRFEDDEQHDAEKEFIASAKKYLSIFMKQ